MLTRIGYAPTRPEPGLTVAYHSACSLQHGQQITTEPKALLRKAGFRVVEPPEGHLCCGSAGTYNMLQPEIATRLRARKLRNIAKTKPDLIAAGNIGCITQLSGDALPVVHTVALLDWMAGGPPDGRRDVRMRRLILPLCPAAVAAHWRNRGRTKRAALDKLLDALRTAPNEQVAAALEDRIRQIWLEAGTPAVTLLMSRGLRETNANAPDDAVSVFSDAIVLDPTLAEAWHQRAIARFKSGDTAGRGARPARNVEAGTAAFRCLANPGADRRGARGLEGRLRRLAARDGHRSAHAGRRGPAEGPEAQGVRRQRVTTAPARK